MLICLNGADEIRLSTGSADTKRHPQEGVSAAVQAH